jgi:SAM-dependent methyltransferase
VTSRVDLYDSQYGNLSLDAHARVRAETYDEDLGQASWVTAAEWRQFLDRLAVHEGGRLVDIGCGSGGLTALSARERAINTVGFDHNPSAIEQARGREVALPDGVTLEFAVADANLPLPAPEASFDAIICNDAINHLAERRAVLQDWARVLRPGGRALYTDPIVVTGQLSSEEIATRSSIGYFLFTPLGVNEDMIAQAGLRLLDAWDATEAVERVSLAWCEARERHREALLAAEGAETYEGLQRFLDTVHRLSGERRLSRWVFLAERPG